jgi:hypothetical protein
MWLALYFSVGMAAIQTSHGLRHRHAGLAFLAMAQHQSGNNDEAKATFARLREIMKQERWANNAEFQGFLREAEHLLEGKPSDKQK